MQDNYQHEFDEQFINQAWTQMSQLLDQEMPVKRNRRPFFWLWWLLGALAIGLAGWGIYSYSQAEPISERTTSPVAAAEIHATEASAAKNSALPAVSPGPEMGQDSRQVSTATLSPASASSPADAVPTPDELKGNSNGGESAATAITDFELNKETLPSDDIEQPGTANASQEIPPSSSPIALPAPASMLKLEATTQLLPSTVFKASLPEPSARIAPLVRMAAEGGVFMQQRSDANGYQAGLAAELHPRGSRFYLRSGIYYRHYNQDFLASERLLVMQNSSWELSGPLPSQNLLAAASTITQTQYLSLPVGIGFQARPRLAIEAGLQASHLIASRQRNTWSLAGDASLPHGQQGANNALLYGSEWPSAASELRSTILEIQAGVAYLPARRIAMRLHYQYGLSGLLLSPYREAHHRGLQLTLSYYVLR